MKKVYKYLLLAGIVVIAIFALETLNRITTQIREPLIGSGEAGGSKLGDTLWWDVGSHALGINVQNPLRSLDILGDIAVSTLNASSCDLKSTTGGVFYCGTDATGAGGSVSSNSLNFDEFQNPLVADTDITFTGGPYSFTFDHASVSGNFEVSGTASISAFNLPDKDGGLLGDCEASTDKLVYDVGLKKFNCGTDATGSGATTLTSTTLQSDAVIATYTAITGLSFTPVANTNYLIDCYIIYTSTAATTGINFAWDVPASVNSIHMSGYTTTTALGVIQGFIQRADNVGTPTSAAIITTEQVAVLQAKLRNGVNATTTALGFTPETANSVSVLAGSVCQYRTY